MLAAIRALNCSERMIRSGRDGRLVEQLKGQALATRSDARTSRPKSMLRSRTTALKTRGPNVVKRRVPR